MCIEDGCKVRPTFNIEGFKKGNQLLDKTV